MSSAVAISDTNLCVDLCEAIEIRFQELLKQQEDLNLISSSEEWISGYYSVYHKDIERLKDSFEKISSGGNVMLYDIGDKMKFVKVEKAIYISASNAANHVKLAKYKDGGEWKSTMNVIPNAYVSTNLTNFCFFSDGHIMQKRSGDRYIPATLKTLAFKAEKSLIFSLFLQAYFDCMSENYPVCKDLLRDFKDNVANLSVPISMNAIIENSWISYHMIFQNNYKLAYEVPKRINRMSLREAYLKTKACKYVEKNDIQKIILFPLPKKLFETGTERELFVEYYRNLIEEPCTNNRLDELEEFEKEIILKDYIKMAISVDKKVSLRIRSFRAVSDEHNKLVNPYMRKNRGAKMVIPKGSPYRKLKLPKNYKMIKTGSRLYVEGEIMHHCVYSYRESVNHGTCVILHVEFLGSPYTAEIRITGRGRKKRFYCQQLFGIRNKPAPKELWEELEEVLEKNQHILGI